MYRSNFYQLFSTTLSRIATFFVSSPAIRACGLTNAGETSKSLNGYLVNLLNRGIFSMGNSWGQWLTPLPALCPILCALL